MKKHFPSLAITALLIFSYSCSEMSKTHEAIETDQLMVRIAEISLEPEYIDEYLTILREEAEASVRLEPGVICIYPMYQKETPAEIRLLEIYADKKAYEDHLQTPHFKHYKTTTLPMVKSLRLVDMQAIDPGTMDQIFVKLYKE